MIQRQANEVGELRKSLREQIQTKETTLEDEFLSDPKQAMQTMLDLQEAKKQDIALAQEQQFLSNKSMINRLVPNYESMIDDIASVIASDGLPPEAINMFKANPYIGNAAILMNLAKRAEIHKKVQSYETKIQTLTNEIATLKKKPTEVASKIANALRSPSAITASSGSGSGGGSPSEIIPGLPTNIDNLPESAIETLLKQRIKEEGLIHG